jgi:hypothetical protein
MKREDLIFYGKLALILGIGITAISLIKKATKKSNSGSGSGRSIIIGDSQTPYIDNASVKVERLGKEAGEKNLWQGGQNLAWLKNAVGKYPTDSSISNVVINIGTNGGFNPKEDISGLISEVKRVFPNAKLFAVQGSWGWGGNKNITEDRVRNYYKIFAKNGVKVIEPPIGAIEPHGNKPIYKEIGRSLDKELS